MEWVYRFVHTHLHGLGKPVPLEFDRHKWCTSRNLRKYYDIIRDAALEHVLAVKNDSFVPGVPYTEEIYWTKPGRVCEMDEARKTKARVATDIKEATGEATQKKALVTKVKTLLIPQAGLLALPAPSVHVEPSGVSATGDAPVEFHEYMYHNGSGDETGDSSDTGIELS